MNTKTYQIYNSKFVLSVVDLTRIDLASDEDKTYQLDYWASLFKAKTWEEIKMLAEKSEFLEEVAQSVYIANTDEIVRQKCRAREEAERYEKTLKRNIKKLQDENASLQDEISSLQDENASLQDEIIKLRTLIADSK